MKLLYVPIVVAGIVFSPLATGDLSPASADIAGLRPAMIEPSLGDAQITTSTLLTTDRSVAAETLQSVTEREQAMTPTQLVERWDSLIKEASSRFNVPEAWIRAVIRMESGGRTIINDRPVTSDAGAMGIMQLMPATYQELRQQYGLGENPYDPHDNVLAGTAYLSWLRERYGFPKMFAAYNAGPGTVETSRRLPQETRDYVNGIARILGTKAPLAEFATAAQPGNKLARLTRPDGKQVSIDGAAVTSIRAPLPDEFAPGVKTVLAMGTAIQGVREDLATVLSLIGRNAGKRSKAKRSKNTILALNTREAA